LALQASISRLEQQLANSMEAVEQLQQERYGVRQQLES